MAGNRYQFTPEFSSEPPLEFARGNYGMNGGSNCSRSDPGSTAAPQGDLPLLTIDEEHEEFRYLGTGVSGINSPLSYSDFTNGAATLIAIDELRAGIHPIDGRGVWAFGQFGGSITWAHGVNGDDFAPNHQWPRADDIQGCGDLHQIVGTQTLMDARMPCVDYVDLNQQATARSQHAGGVHTLYVDGHVGWIADAVDPGLWHVLHSRETPAAVLEGPLDVRLRKTNELRDASSPPRRDIPVDAPEKISNSLGMSFVLLPSGEFEMGLGDQGYPPPPPAAPTHHIELTRPFYLGQHEVTQSQFESVMGRNPSHHRSPLERAASTADYPVEQVTWDDAADGGRMGICLQREGG
ncbi:MAG: hypothetical protein B7Z55_09045 [Planctomycetales bacterium 12-60-4]|nr:MAG: hypothetical protein B7Z55_09045 [Planctomycetales bacterium 12-60-4]